MTIPDMVDLLLRATPDELWVTIPEGYRLSQIAQVFGSSGLGYFNANTFLQSVQTGTFDGSQNYWFLQHDPQGPKKSTPLEGYVSGKIPGALNRRRQPGHHHPAQQLWRTALPWPSQPARCLSGK